MLRGLSHGCCRTCAVQHEPQHPDRCRCHSGTFIPIATEVSSCMHAYVCLEDPAGHHAPTTATASGSAAATATTTAAAAAVSIQFSMVQGQLGLESVPLLAMVRAETSMPSSALNMLMPCHSERICHAPTRSGNIWRYWQRYIEGGHTSHRPPLAPLPLPQAAAARIHPM